MPLWIAYPLGYGLLIEARGAVFPSVPVKYPYFFLDPSGHGHGWVGLQFGQLAIVFGVFAAAVVGLDRFGAMLGGGRATRPGRATVGGEEGGISVAESLPGQRPAESSTTASPAG